MFTRENRTRVRLYWFVAGVWLLGCTSGSPSISSDPATAPAGNRRSENAVLKDSLLMKDQQIGALNALLLQRDEQLKEKDAEIQQLKKKLETFGIF